MEQSAVSQALLEDRWSLAELQHEAGLAICRWRTPVLGPPDVGGYDRLVKVLWPYADAGSGALPFDEVVNQLQRFEERLCEAWEKDGLAYLSAVLTFDGARQWVFYTYDIAECGSRLNQMPQESEPYPLELEAEDDPEWNYLRERILKSFPWGENQP